MAAMSASTRGDTDEERTSGRRRGISIHRAADAPHLVETDFMELPGPGGPLPEPVASGTQVRVLVRDDQGFSLVHAWFKSGFPVGRHSHNADCMYYVIGGAATLGSQTLAPGDSFFVPADAPYGYVAGPDGVEVLEIRHGCTQFDLRSSGDSFPKIVEAFEANRERWTSETVPPSMVANSGL